MNHLKRHGTSENDTLKKGDVVLVNNTQDAREYWRTTIIEEVLNNEQGKARIVRIRDNCGNILIRHINSLVRLEMAD